MRKIRPRTYILPLVILSLFIFKVSAQGNDKMQHILGKLATYTNDATPEKVYLQTDRDFYSTGDTIWYKAYVLNGITHTPSTMSRVVYTELVDSKDNIITKQKLYTASSGAAGDFTLPQEIEEGSYKIRAYTNYMLNDKEPILFHREITVLSPPSGFDVKNKRNGTAKKKALKQEATRLKTGKPVVQFFPEGGELITGIESVLGVKVTDSKGNGLALKGKILDQNGNLASLFDSYEFGLGWSYLKPEPNTDYYLHIPIDGTMVKYPVPQPVEKGYALRVMNRGGHIMITASTTIANGLQNGMLVGHTRGDVIFKQVLKGNDENSTTIKLLTSKLQDGIAHFTLFTPNKEPVCERLTFIENPENNLDLSIETNKSNYGLREKMNVDLAVVDADAKPLEGDFSMSVFAKSEMQEGAKNIKSWLLLNSDLGSTISNPTFFFKEEVNGREYLLDLLMLVHGWRRFTWKSILDDSVPKEIAFPPEKGIMINGITTAFMNQQRPKKSVATLNILAKELTQEKKVTDTLGRFSFGPFIFEDSIAAVLNANSVPLSKERKDRFSIYLDPSFPEVPIRNPQITGKSHTKKIVHTSQKTDIRNKTARNITADFEYDPKLIKLKEVVVKDKKISKQALLDKKLNAKTLHGYPSTRLMPDSIPGLGKGAVSAFSALRYVAGARVIGTFPNERVVIRGEIPSYLLDGVPASADQIQSIRISDILFIDVLKGADAAIYGGRGGSGVVAVYTKTGEFIEERPKEFSGVVNVTIHGFYKAREFYKPNYAITKLTHKKPDYRRTLHWEPNIELKDDSVAKLNFYTGDIESEYVIRIEGITTDGRPVHELYNFDVQETE